MKQSIATRAKTRIFMIVAAASIAVAAPLTSSADHPAAGPDDVIAGAGAHFAWVIFDMLKQELEEKSNRQIVLFGKNSTLGVGCNAGIKMAKQNVPGRETFGFVCCPLDQEEIDKEGLIVYPLADEPIMILVNQDNPVDNLSSDQVKQIFKGEITNWKQVGGSDESIVVVTRLHCKKRPGHWKTILPSAEKFKEDRINVKSADQMVGKINEFTGAFGHTGSTWKFEDTDKIKIVKVDGYAPTAENLRSGKYPFHRRLSAITNRQPSEDVLNIIQAVKEGNAFQAVTKKYQLVPIKNTN
jgi:ABC-type phosphate transport system substrate-binding protein